MNNWTNKKDGKRMLTVREAAELLGAGESSVRMWCADGKFPHAQSLDTPRGPVWLIPESDLNGFEKRERGRPSKSKTEKQVSKKPAKK